MQMREVCKARVRRPGEYCYIFSLQLCIAHQHAAETG